MIIIEYLHEFLVKCLRSSLLGFDDIKTKARGKK